MIRFFDILFSFIGLVLGMPVFLLLFIIGLIDNGSPLFFQKRLGRNKKPFTLIKFRTMKVNTSSMPTHMIDASSITTLGHFLRQTKLDEIPQLWNVLLGDMSLVGPRPCLSSQHELINARALRGVFNVRPGVTGLAQVKNIDMSTPELLATSDATMLETLTLRRYFYYLLQTFLGKGRGDNVRK